MNMVILLAAGRGLRFGREKPKQFFEYKGKPLLSYSLETLLEIPEVNHIVLVTNPELDVELKSVGIVQENLTRLSIIDGGETRTESIKNGLNFSLSFQSKDLPTNFIVHDSSRPFTSKSHFLHFIHASSTNQARVTSKLIQDAYMIRKSNNEFEHCADGDLITFQTPIAFGREIAEQIIQQMPSELKFGLTGLLVELGANLTMVESDGSSRKVTFANDLTY
jgi:2-C-methyl-D-erythritol 4-phosphate cytidylyltransferase